MVTGINKGSDIFKCNMIRGKEIYIFGRALATVYLLRNLFKKLNGWLYVHMENMDFFGEISQICFEIHERD